LKRLNGLLAQLVEQGTLNRCLRLGMS
jgi:hypothetical protein